MGELPTTEQEGELRQSPAGFLGIEGGLDSPAAGAGGQRSGEKGARERQAERTLVSAEVPLTILGWEEDP